MKHSLQTTTSLTSPRACWGGGLVALICLLAISTTLSAKTPEQQLKELTAEVDQLQRKNAALVESLVQANKQEKESSEALAQVRQRLEALGKNLIDGKDDRLVSAVADIQVLNKRLQHLEESSLKLSAVIQSYLKTALHADPDERKKVEAAARELDVALGLRNAPQRSVNRGSLDSARIVSIDSETGLVVLNVGSNAGAQIGMNFNVERNQNHIAKLLIAETRKNISGGLVQSLSETNQQPQIGDLAVVQLQQTR